MVKLIACDIDGTLIRRRQREIDPAVFTEVERLMDAGVIFCAASGRQYSSLRELFAPVADRIYYICENGAVVIGPGSHGEIIASMPMPRKPAVELCRDIMRHDGYELMASGAYISYLCPKSPSFAALVQGYLDADAAVLADPDDIPEDILKVSAYNPDGIAPIAREMSERWGEQFNVAVAGELWIDFTVADKGRAVSRICSALGIPLSEAAAFGDSYNDIPMLDCVGHPHIMSTAERELLDRYSVHCDRVEDALREIC
ncbi:MAG: Cof-type HAD-IIB family hydrolase [Oscillospiraceae bacterium]|nr:Cof-type HAD-IIB family hydrolase [Oscillospiraceae bacterium]